MIGNPNSIRLFLQPIKVTASNAFNNPAFDEPEVIEVISNGADIKPTSRGSSAKTKKPEETPFDEPPVVDRLVVSPSEEVEEIPVAKQQPEKPKSEKKKKKRVPKPVPVPEPDEPEIDLPKVETPPAAQPAARPMLERDDTILYKGDEYYEDRQNALEIDEATQDVSNSDEFLAPVQPEARINLTLINLLCILLQ